MMTDDRHGNAASRARIRAATAALCLCLALAARPSPAQEMKILSKDTKAPIVLLFYPERNETEIVAPTGALEDMTQLGAMGRQVYTGPPPAKNLSLWQAHYSYAGQTPARPRSVTFTFYVNRKADRFKDKQSFSVSADGAVVQQGEVVPEDRTVEGGEKPSTRKVLAVAIPTEVFLDFTRAKKVTFQLGPEKYQLNDKQRNHIRALAGTIEALGG